MVQPKAHEPRLVHPALHKIPMQMRFAMAGLLSNVIFMVLYNSAVVQFDQVYATASTIYSVVYFCFIPISHALMSLLVFGWPTTHYLSSLLSNYPIGLTAIALGAACTAYFDKIGFNESVEDFIRDTLGLQVGTDVDEKGEFYSSLLVMVITSAWSYVLSVAVNAPSANDPSQTLPLKKEL